MTHNDTDQLETGEQHSPTAELALQFDRGAILAALTEAIEDGHQGVIDALERTILTLAENGQRDAALRVESFLEAAERGEL